MVYLYVMEKNGQEFKSGYCNSPKAFLQHVRAQDPYARYVWVFPMPLWAARKARAFLQRMSTTDHIYWSKQPPEVVHGWVMKIIGLAPNDQDWGMIAAELVESNS